jgi:tetratricopeptide (TPR) repeat protein
MKRLLSLCILALSLHSLAGHAQSLQHPWDDAASLASMTVEKRIEAYLAAADFYKDSLLLSTTYGNQALELALENKNLLLEARSKQTLAMIYLDQDLYDKALVFAYEALADYQKLHDEQGQLLANGVLGWVYYDAGQTEKALDFHQKLLAAYRKKGSKEDVVWTTNAIGLDYSQLKNYSLALKYFKESLTLSRTLNQPERISASLNNIGMMQTAQGLYREGLTSLKEGYRLSIQLGNVLKQGENLNQLGNTYYQMKKLDSAEYYLTKARAIITTSKANARKEKLIDNYEFSTKVYLAKNDYQNAFQFLAQYMKLKDEVISLEKSNNLTNALMVHQTQQKEQEIKLLESENKLKVLQRDALAGAILLITIIGVLLYNKQVTTQKKERLILEAQQALTQKELARASLEKEAFEKEYLLSEAQKQLAQNDLERANLEKEALQANLDFKNSEFTNAAIHLSQRNELIRSFLDELKQLNLRSPSESSSRITKIIDHFSQVQGTNKDAEAFHLNMEAEYKDFLFKLTNRFPDLTDNEKRLCGQIRLNLSIKDIASINNISVKSVEMARYRLRKKLNMEHEENLGGFLNNL